MTLTPWGETSVTGLAPVMRLGGVLLPLVGRARVYACGITPYDVTHLGHAAAFSAAGISVPAPTRPSSGRRRRRGGRA